MRAFRARLQEVSKAQRGIMWSEGWRKAYFPGSYIAHAALFVAIQCASLRLLVEVVRSLWYVLLRHTVASY